MAPQSVVIGSFPKDYRLRQAYELYEYVTGTFKAAYGRPPACDIYVGAVGDKEKQVSTVTARWDSSEKHVQCLADAQQCVNLAEVLKAA